MTTTQPHIAGPKMEGAACRHCRRPLFGKDYCYGGRAWVPDTNSNFTYNEAKKNYYGGFVCSRSCDFRASLALEQSMPGHGMSQKSLGQSAQRSLEANWDHQ